MLNNSFIVIGRITSTHGIKGWVSIESYSSDTEDIFDYKLFLNTNGNFKRIDISNYRLMPKKIIAKIKSIDSIDLAEKFIDCKIYIKSNQLSNLDKDEYYWNDLIGCSVYSNEKCLLGNVTNIIRNSSSDILVIKNNANQEEILIPFIKDFLLEVNLKEKTIGVDWKHDY
tara:strand:+ start:36 stop:545 length:510 start_codon:yes stop_codon:yes gene_type:complete